MTVRSRRSLKETHNSPIFKITIFSEKIDCFINIGKLTGFPIASFAWKAFTDFAIFVFVTEEIFTG